MIAIISTYISIVKLVDDRISFLIVSDVESFINLSQFDRLRLLNQQEHWFSFAVWKGNTFYNLIRLTQFN